MPDRLILSVHDLQRANYEAVKSMKKVSGSLALAARVRGAGYLIERQAHLYAALEAVRRAEEELRQTKRMICEDLSANHSNGARALTKPTDPRKMPTS